MHPPAEAPVEQIRLLGGHPCLDFVNTVDDRVHGARDSLVDHRSLAAWALRVGLIEAREAAALERLADGPEGARSFDRAVGLRERLYGIFAALAAGGSPPQEDLDALQASFAAGMSHARLVERPEGYSWSWRERKTHVDRVAWAVARSALDLLCSGRLDRLKVCPGHDCGWLFLDLSRNRSRRWCSMDGCGSRAKMRTLYRRRKAAADRAR